MDVLVPNAKMKTRCFHAWSCGWMCTCLLCPLIVFEMVFLGMNIYGLLLFQTMKDKGLGNKTTTDGKECHMKDMIQSEVVISIILIVVLASFVFFLFCMGIIQIGYYLSTLVPKCPTIPGAREVFLLGGPILISAVCVFISLQLLVFGLITLIHYKQSDYIKVHSTGAIFTKYELVEYTACTTLYHEETVDIDRYLTVKTILYNVFFYLFLVGEIVGILLLWVGPFLFVLIGVLRERKKKYQPLTDDEID